LYEGKDYKVKELVIKPHSELSMQRHEHRSETWNLVSGQAKLRLIHHGVIVEDDLLSTKVIPKGTWHQGYNDSDYPAHIVEIWRGDSEYLNEEDIERKN
jgi:mannose-6-phosphate isomerase-like protein (cupin superfamily)